MKLMISNIIIIGSVLIGCKKEDPQASIQLPSNLQTEVVLNEGLVTITATANDANFYSFMFFEGTDSTYIESNEGIGSYTFQASGTYTIRTKAHASAADYTEKIETVTVNITPGFQGGMPDINGGYSTPIERPGYTLVWSDEFDGTALSSEWVHEIGNGNWGWGNNELQYYRPENTTVGNGVLTITAKPQNFGGFNYTSSRIKTQGLKSFQYGRVDIRAAVPYSKGIWPALWMLGDNITSVSWPACGEIDIMELIGGTGYNDRTVHGTIHWDQNGSHANYGGSNSLLSGMYAENFHVFSIIWDANEIRWLRDDVQYHVASITPAAMSEFHENFFFIFNVAVGGNWPGNPDASTVFPQSMYVDYVRVFQ